MNDTPQTREKAAYKNQSKKLLENSFPLISCAAITVVLNHVDFKFTEAFYALYKIQAAYPDSGGLEHPFAELLLPQVKVFLKQYRPKPKRRLNIRDLDLLDEIHAIPEMNNKSEKNDEAIEEGEDEDGEDGTTVLVECGCCFGEYPLEDMKECSANAGHQVCKICIYRYVSEQLDGNNSIQFRCIVSDGCSEIYPTTTLLDEVLTPKLKQRTNDRIFRSEVEQAGIENMWNCPKCALLGFLDKPYPTVYCSECKLMYCSTCKQVAHDNKTCEEAKEERERLDDPIHLAHEKMSQATIRRCPNCNVSFTKHDGCNKMTCMVTGCNTMSCYLCGVKVKGYAHFCNSPGCQCGKCELWTKAEKMDQLDRQARHEAGRKVLQEAGFTAKDVEQALASPPTKAPPPPLATRVNVAMEPARAPPPRANVALEPEGAGPNGWFAALFWGNE